MVQIEPLIALTSDLEPQALGFVECEGGVCAAAGVRAGGMWAGIRPSPGKSDLALVAADEACACAGTFTTNRFCAAPVELSRAHVATGSARAVLLNSGGANAATGEPGMRVARETCAITARALDCAEDEVLVASTGVIGQQLPLEPFQTGVPALAESISATAEAAHEAALAIMTTDTVPKEFAIEGDVEGATAHVGGMCKGSGMISPNMATMLAVVTTDLNLTPAAASEALSDAVRATFNKVTVDSDTSTNDTCILLATGKAGGSVIDVDSPGFELAALAVRCVCEALARKIASDGEGASKLVTVDVMGAATPEDADTVARAIANSPLVKTAICGHDANWGRVAGAAGKCGVAFDQRDVDIDFLGVPVCRGGLSIPMDEEDMLRRFEAPEVPIVVNLGMGECAARVWTCDLTHDYVSINGDYRS